MCTVQAYLEKVGEVAPAPEETIQAPNKTGNLMGGWEPCVPLKTSTTDQFRRVNYTRGLFLCGL